jgi:hypothetical protein
MKTLITALTTAVLTFAPVIGEAQPIPFGPVPFSETVAGQQVPFSVSGSVEVLATADGYDVAVHTLTDLSGLQTVIPQMIQAQATHRDSCGDDIDVHTIRLQPAENGTAELFVAGHYAKWACPTLHVLQSHGLLDWRWEELRLAKTIAVEQSGSVDLRLKPVIVDGGKTIDLTISAREIKADGLLGNVLQLPIIGPQILDSAIKNLILNQINGHIGSSLRQSIPAQLASYAPKVVQANLVNLGDGRLGIDLSMAGHIAKAQVTQLISQALTK